MELMIRKAELSDIPDIMKIENLAFAEPWKEISFREEISSHEVFVLMKNSKLAAYICGWKILDEYNITNLAVKENLRRNGLAEKLVSYIIEIHRKDCSLIYLEVRESNLAARKLYKKMGFGVIGVRKNYYPNPREDAVVMEINLPVEVL